MVAKALCERYDLTGPDALICGNAVGPGGNIGRLLLLEGGLPERVPALTIDLQCASGLAAVHMAALAIMAGEWDVVLAGGVESASLQPRAGMRKTMKGVALEIPSSRQPSSAPESTPTTPCFWGRKGRRRRPVFPERKRMRRPF